MVQAGRKARHRDGDRILNNRTLRPERGGELPAARLDIRLSGKLPLAIYYVYKGRVVARYVRQGLPRWTTALCRTWSFWA